MAFQTRSVATIISNPKTDASTLDYDFAILELNSPVGLNVVGGNIGAVCLPKVGCVECSICHFY